MIRSLSIGALLCAATPLLAQSVVTITNAGAGHAVPQPVDSLEPVAGYRSMSSLQARYMALSLEKSFITPNHVGTSLLGRDIYAYRFLRGGLETPEGIQKGAAMSQGTIHAREWAALESAAGTFEWLALESDTDPAADFILDHLEIVLSPLANPDGIAMTQLYYNQTIGTSSTGGDGSDGRMRRKNMRNTTDEVLSTTSDYLQGVDLNRNHPIGFGNGSSSAANSITYHGTAPGSEPESQALYAAAGLLDESRLRFYVDLHSYQQLLYVNQEAGSGRNTYCIDSYEVMEDGIYGISGREYSQLDWFIGTDAIGATDEYFSGTYHCMSYTLEIQPRTPSGFPNGFILPNEEADQTRREIVAAMRAGLYYASGPPVLKDIQIYVNTTGTVTGAPVYTETRDYDSLSGQRVVSSTTAPLSTSNSYAVVLHFDRPMREGGLTLIAGTEFSPIANVTLGSVAATSPSFPISTGDALGYARYPADTLVVNLDLRGKGLTDGVYTLSVDVNDMVGTRLDADPRTVVDWSAEGWTNWESGAGVAGKGGVDSLAHIPVTQLATLAGRNWILY